MHNLTNMFSCLFWLDEYIYTTYNEAYTFPRSDGTRAKVRIDEVAFELWNILRSTSQPYYAYRLSINPTAPNSKQWQLTELMPDSPLYHLQDTIHLRQHDSHRRVLLTTARAVWHGAMLHEITYNKQSTSYHDTYDHDNQRESDGITTSV